MRGDGEKDPINYSAVRPYNCMTRTGSNSYRNNLRTSMNWEDSLIQRQPSIWSSYHWTHFGKKKLMSKRPVFSLLYPEFFSFIGFCRKRAGERRERELMSFILSFLSQHFKIFEQLFSWNYENIKDWQQIKSNYSILSKNTLTALSFPIVNQKTIKVLYF